MYYTYCIESLQNAKLYIGSTSNLKKRLFDHNDGMGGDFTSHNGPWKLIYYEAYLHKEDAMAQEKYYKTGFGRDTLKKKLQTYFGSRSAQLGGDFRFWS